MKRLTKLTKKQIIMRSLLVAILAAAAFVSVPSLLPENAEGMKRSVAAVECREQYEIRSGGKTVAYFNDISLDSTLTAVKEKGDSDTERKAMVCGCWINRLSFLPSCRGRIFTVNPFCDGKGRIVITDKNIGEILDKTIRKIEEKLKECRKKKGELDYYLKTHSVKDEGYNTIAKYADENMETKKNLESSLQILKVAKGQKNIEVAKKLSYTLIYSPDGKSVRRVVCHDLPKESDGLPKGGRIIQTHDNFMPEGANGVYRFDVFSTVPEKGDTIAAAGMFGIVAGSAQDMVMQGANVFKGTAMSAKAHDIPQLLAPDGAPLFNRHGFFIGINRKGSIVR